MENGKSHTDYVTELLETLNDESMSLIDFDRLREWLSRMARVQDDRRELKEQLEHLRSDYEQRIGGMVKAMAALDRRQDSWPEALTLVESLQSMPAGELVSCYRRVAARFRDCFPASFGLLRQSGRPGSSRQDVSVYK
ncbi:MAG TPA: hypothetical protein VMY05_00180 [Acidobacteriota bacterium]|nr:hypothetical protein [Acidobacteriota bacterium]